MLSHFIYCYAEYHYAECHYAEGRYAECHSAIFFESRGLNKKNFLRLL
jgi:hypothetical protein